MNGERKFGFPPVYDKNSRILILGSFPSVKSREIQFYYGHKQNRFWKTLCGYFGVNVPETVDAKRAFLLSHGVALWDIAEACEIDGSSDASLRNAEIVDLTPIFEVAKIEKIFLNGATAYKLFLERYADLTIPYEKLPSTSPANPRFSERTWQEALDKIFTLK